LYEGQALADEIVDWLRQRNFPLIGVYNTYYDSNEKAIQANSLFRRSRAGT
jgi:hypothetical protein